MGRLDTIKKGLGLDYFKHRTNINAIRSKFQAESEGVNSLLKQLKKPDLHIRVAQKVEEGNLNIIRKRIFNDTDRIKSVIKANQNSLNESHRTLARSDIPNIKRIENANDAQLRVMQLIKNRRKEDVKKYKDLKNSIKGRKENVTKLQKERQVRSTTQKQFAKDLKQARSSNEFKSSKKRLALTGVGVGTVATGAGIGGYKMNKKKKNPDSPENNSNF